MTEPRFTRELNALDLTGEFSIGSKARISKRDIDPENACLRRAKRGHVVLSDVGPSVTYSGGPVPRWMAAWLLFKAFMASRRSNGRYLAWVATVARPTRRSSREIQLSVPPMSSKQSDVIDVKIKKLVPFLRRAAHQVNPANWMPPLERLGAAATVVLLVILGMALQQRFEAVKWDALLAAWAGRDTAVTHPSAPSNPAVGSSDVTVLASVIRDLVRDRPQPGGYFPTPMGVDIPSPELSPRPKGTSLLNAPPLAHSNAPPRDKAAQDTVADERDVLTLPSAKSSSSANPPKTTRAEGDWDFDLPGSVPTTDSRSKVFPQASALGTDDPKGKMVADKDSSPRWKAVTANDGALVIRVGSAKGFSFQQVRPGVRLPNGELLRSVQQDAGTYTTDAGSFSFNQPQGEVP